MSYRLYILQKNYKLNMYDCTLEEIETQNIKYLYCSKKDILNIIKEYNPIVYLHNSVKKYFKEITKSKEYKQLTMSRLTPKSVIEFDVFFK